MEEGLFGTLLQTILVGIICGLTVIWLVRKGRYNMPPGQLGWPVVGNTFQLGKDERYYMKFYEWSKIYGPVITVKIGVMTIVVVNDIESAMEVLVKKSTDFAGRQETPSMRLASDHYRNLPLTPYGPTWKLNRRETTTALRHLMQGEGIQKRIHTALRTTFRALDEQTGPFNPDEVLTFLVTNILMGICFEGEFEYGNKELKYIIDKGDQLQTAFNNLVPEDIFPALEYVYKSKAMKTMESTLKDLVDGFIAGKYNEVKQTFDRNNIRHFTDSLLLARADAERESGKTPEYLTDRYILQTLLTIFIGGINTTRFSLGFAVLHMVAFPEIQTKVQEEIDRVVGKDRLPKLSDRPNLCYTEAVLRESMRMGTVLPGGLAHRTTCDTTIGKYSLRKGTLVMINHWALHNDPNAWVKVDQFIPERFLDENGQLGPKPDNWLPFSAGKRVCLGEFVAKPELHLLFAALMQQFSWRTESGMKPDISPDGTLMFAHPRPHKVQVTRRN